MVQTAEEYQQFIKNTDPATIATCLRQDQQSCRDKQLPSALATYLPSAATCAFSNAIAKHLSPHDGIPVPILRMQYKSIVGGIRAYLAQMHEVIEEQDPWVIDQQTVTIPSSDDLAATLKVLDYLEQHGSTDLSPTAISDVRTAVQTQLGMEESFRTAYHFASQKTTKAGALGRQRRCYICRMKPVGRGESLHPSLCAPCERFNRNCSDLSAPLVGMEVGVVGFLTQRTALVTGGRINLGIHTALRLLRLDCHVIVSTRYPHDAESRYAAQPDFDSWGSRLKIVGADFRTAADAFRLVQTVKDTLEEWALDRPRYFGGPLDILINNAAQTLTDPVGSEVKAIAREEQLQITHPQDKTTPLVVEDGYHARVRGGMQTAWMAGIEDRTRRQIENGEIAEPDTNGPIQKGLGGDRHEEQITKSSWTQTLQEIPYEDLISAHAVNAFVPLILCRELLPLMTGRKEFPPYPYKHIVNVSSREGILENQPDSTSKGGHHVHTNMSKAAINMITESEAGPAWKLHGVCMNTVDPGYMSAAPEMLHLGPCPIGFEDGAARVLYPVAVGYKSKTTVRGRFLKHFGAVEAIIRRG